MIAVSSASYAEPISVRVVARIGDGVATEAPTRALANQSITLHAVVSIGKKFYSDVSPVVIGGKKIATLPIEPLHLGFAWNKIEPAAASYSNEDETGFHYTKIEYKPTKIDKASGAAITADVHPTLTPDYGNGLGTMRYQVVVADGDRSAASPGIEAVRGGASGGLRDEVMRVSIRKDDSILGYMTEMYGQPYIWGSAGPTSTVHQSERLEGSDCADLMVYGARRGGKSFAYSWTGSLPQITKLVASAMRDPETGIFVDAKNHPVPFPKIGDLVLFPRHVGALVFDRGTIGVLDDHDIVLHTNFDSPKEQPIALTGYADKPIEIRRWK